MTDNAARVTGHLDAALVALQTAQDSLALAAVLASADTEMQNTLGQSEVQELRNASAAINVSESYVTAQQQKWHEYLVAREAEDE